MKYLLKMHRYRREYINIQVIESVLHDIFPKSLIIGDKYPDYVFWLDEFVQCDRLYRLIIYRDCRDVTSSVLQLVRTTWRKMPFKERFDTAEKIAKQWVRSIELMEYHANMLHIICYEELIRKPLWQLERIGKWLRVDHRGFSAKRIKNNCIGKYKNGLSEEELTSVMNIAGPTMARLGYCS